MAKFTQTYPTGLKYTEWLRIMDFFPTHRRGRPRKWEMWQILNAILFVVRTGCQWRMLPTNLPPWQTVYGYFRHCHSTGGRCACELGSQPVPGCGRGFDVYQHDRGRNQCAVVEKGNFLEETRRLTCQKGSDARCQFLILILEVQKRRQTYEHR